MMWMVVWLAVCLSWGRTGALPCSELSRDLRYPCDCELEVASEDGGSSGGDQPHIHMNCDHVVFAGELPALPYGAPIVSFRQRHAGHQALPPQLFGESALPLRSVDFCGNLLRRLADRLLSDLQHTLLELHLADNLLGDTLNPIFSSSAFHGLGHLQLLDLSGNSIRAIEEGVLKGCANLQEVRLDRNSLTSIPSGSLNGPKNLRILSLSRNRIKSIPSGAFKAQSSMEQLDVSHNLVGSIESYAFQDMDKLRTINLSYNRLVRFNSDIFNGANNLQYLDLADNFIAEFPTVALRAFTGLRYLNLSSNVIQNIDNGNLRESLVHLYQLDLSRNNIGNIAPGTFLGLKQLRSLDLSVNSLRTIEDDAFEGLDNLETLSIKDNNILLIPASALGRLPRLSSLRLDYNRIAALSGDILRSLAERLTTLVLARNVIRELPAATFQHFQQMEGLDLSGNLLTSLSSDTFAGLERTLRILRAPHNKIASLFGASPLALPALEVLDLSDNRLTELERDVFSQLSALLHLNLSGNPLTSASAFPSGLLHHVPLLQVLDLSAAGLRALPTDLLQETRRLSRVLLRDNALSELADGAFVNLTSLAVVDLSANNLTNIRTRAFVNAMGIRELYLNGNRLSSFKGEIFNTGTGLEVLDLSHNELTYLYPSSFRIHPRLRRLLVAWNKLSYFPAELVAGLQYLEEVQLAHNHLKSVDELDFGRLPRLRSLSLAHNMLEAVSEMAFHNSTQLQRIDLSHNRIERLGERTFEGLVRIEMLSLEANRLADLPDTIFERYRLHMLENVNLASNEFEAAPLRSLQRQYFFVSSVDLSRNRIRDIPPDHSVMVNIKRLDLSYNPLSAESVANVLGEPKTVRQLNLAATGIEHVPRLETPFLHLLNLSRNRIASLPDAIFERTSLLQTLDLSRNELSAVPTPWPLLKDMQELDISVNPIVSVSHNDFLGLESLRMLSMHTLPECTRIEKNAFRSLPNLAHLTAFGYPKLGYVDVRGVLELVPALEYLHIETKEAALGADQLRPALQPRLRELAVTGLRLKSVSSGTLSGLKAGTLAVRFRNTSLSALPPALFFPVPRSTVITLDVTGGQLATLSTQTLSALEDRRDALCVQGLDSNPLRCDCMARALRRWVRAMNDANVRAVCRTPPRLAGRTLASVADDELVCQQQVAAVPVAPSSAAPPTSKAPAARLTAEPEIIWSVVAATDRLPAIAKPKPTLGAGTNDDTLIIGVVGGVVAFIAVLMVAIWIVKVRSSGGSGLAPVLAPAPPPGAASSCACSTKGAAAPLYAATLPHKYNTTPVRHAHSTMGRLPPYYQPPPPPHPYFVALPSDEKIYR